MSRQAIHDQLVIILDAVTGVENVYPYHPQQLDPANFISSFREADATDIQVWSVRRTATRNRSSETHRGQVPIRSALHRYHTFILEGWYSFKAGGTTEDAFNDLLDSIMTAFDNKRSLNNSSFQATPIDLVLVNTDVFGHVLCHHAIFEITAMEIISGLAPS